MLTDEASKRGRGNCWNFFAALCFHQVLLLTGVSTLSRAITTNEFEIGRKAFGAALRDITNWIELGVFCVLE